MAFSFIPLFYYFHFLVLVLSFFSWRKAIHHDGGEQQQNPNSEGGGWFISSLCSTFSFFSPPCLFPGGKNERGKRWGGRRRWRETNRNQPLWKPSGKSAALCKQSGGGTDGLTSKVKNVSTLRGLFCKEGDERHQSNSSSSPCGSLFCVLLFDMNRVRTKGTSNNPLNTDFYSKISIYGFSNTNDLNSLD